MDDADDEFFGEQEGFETKGHHKNDHHEGLAVAESSATAERFRTLGYHETCEQAKNMRLQEGFEAGFRENYDASKRIGEMLGKYVMQAKLDEKASKDANDISKNTELTNWHHAARCTYEYLATNESGDINLKKLEHDLKDIMTKRNS